MGKKERERKSKRNLAPQTYRGKRPAPGSGNPASRHLEVWHSASESSESVSSGEVETERELSRTPAPNPAAGSGNPASSVSSGGVEAEWKLVEPEVKVKIPTCEGGDHKVWIYDEGKGGKYTCSQCGTKVFRSEFLIEAQDGEGNLCCEYDKEGRLDGRCYECCRGRSSEYPGPTDIYEGDTRSDKVLKKRFKSCAIRGTSSAATSRKRVCVAEDQRMAGAHGENHRTNAEGVQK